MGLTSTAFFMICLDSVVVATALPRIQQSLHIGFASLQWTVNAYNIAIAAGIICGAALGDRYGRRRLYLVGLLLFTLSSAGCALASSGAALIAARTAQGLGGALILPLSLTILTEAVPVARRATIFGIYGGLAGLAVAAGPIVGGAITQGISWHWIFWINVPIGVATVLLSSALLPESKGRAVPLDLLGVALISVSMIAIVWGLVRANDVGWTNAEIVAALVVGIVTAIAFVGWEARTTHPMLSLHLLRIPAFSAGNAVAFCQMAAISAGAFLTAQYFQFALGYSPLQAGLRLLPFFGTPMIVAPIAGKATAQLGVRTLIVAGMALLGAGFIYVALAASVHPSYPMLVIALCVAGIGVSMTIPTVPAAVLGAVEQSETGTASATNNLLQRFGAVFGIAVATSVFSAHGHIGTASSFTDGFRPGVAVAAALALVGALAGIAVSRRAQAAAPLEVAESLA